MIFAPQKIYGPLLWMEFHCLKATDPVWGGSLLFTTESPGVVLSQPWSHPVVLNWGSLDWKSSTLNTRPLKDYMQIKLFKNEQLAALLLNGDIGHQQWQFIFSLFVKLAKKIHIFKLDLLSLNDMNKLWTAVK